MEAPFIVGAFRIPVRTPGGRVSERLRRDFVDVRQRLLQYAREGAGNVPFGWLLVENPHDAYRLECYLWHPQGCASARIEGDTHPVPAERIPFLGCPDCEE